MTPVDQADRDRIVGCLDETLFVDAGAGSGKTTQLVGRICELVRHGRSIERIAAITFTEAAASELRHRLRRELQRAAASDGEPIAAERCAVALQHLDSAAISTLHSFAQRLLRSAPIEAGLPPAVEVLDEIRAVLRFATQWQVFFDDWIEDPTATEMFRSFLAVGGKPDQLEALARFLGDHSDRLTRASREPELARVDTTTVLGALDRALSLAEQCPDETDLLYRHIQDRIAPVRAQLAGCAQDRVAVLSMLSPGRKDVTWKLNRGRGANWADLAAVRAALEDAEAAAHELRQVHIDATLRIVLARISNFVLDLADQRRRDGLVSFHDLLVLARDVLAGHPEVRARLAAEFDALLIDEFQDTDALQIEIVHLLASGSAAQAGGRWSDHAIEPGRIFFVGDPKQSIYRFRRAEVRRFIEAREHHSAGAVALTTNFRTVEPMVDWVNHTFSRLITAGNGQADYTQLAPFRPPLGDGRPPVLALGGPGALKEPIGSVRARGADELAGALAALVDQRWPVQDPQTKDLRPVRWSDMVVLVPSRTSVSALEQGLAGAGVPYRLLTSSLMWEAQEIRDVLAVVRAVHDPNDQVAIVAALRSPLFGCGDDELSAWRSAGGRWEFVGLGDDRPQMPQRVAASLQRLAELSQQWWSGPDQLVAHVVESLGAMELAAVAGEPRELWRRLRFLVDQAQAFSESERGSVGEFLAWVDLQGSDSIRVNVAHLPDLDDDAVQVMTIHGSKGLEFGVVALFGLDSTPMNRPGVKVSWNDAGQPQLKLGAAAGESGFEALLPIDEQLDRHERLRLLYVAATRARDRLILCLHRKAVSKPPQEGSKSFAQLLEELLDDAPSGTWQRWRPEDPEDSNGSRPEEPLADAAADVVPVDGPVSDEVTTDDGVADAVLDAEVAALLESIEADRTRRAARPPAAVSATEISRRARAAGPAGQAAGPAGQVSEPAGQVSGPADDGVESDVVAALDDGSTRTFRRGRAGTAIGRAVHAVLQVLNASQIDQVDALAARAAVTEGLAAEGPTVARLARAALASPLLADLDPGDTHRELYLSAPIGASVLEGYVDLLIDDGAGGYVLVDYKTDAARTPAEIRARAEGYRLQLATYAVLVEAVTQRPVRRACMIFLSGDQATEVDVEDLPGAMAQVRSMLDVIPAAGE